MIRSLIILASFLFFSAAAQPDLQKELMVKTATLTEVTHKGEAVLYQTQQAAANLGIKCNPKMEMKVYLYDDTKPAMAAWKNSGFKKGDVVVQYSWDKEDYLVPTNTTIGKLKYTKKDSSFVISELRNVHENIPLKQKTRHFKVVSQEKDKFTLEDKDFTDQQRRYLFTLEKAKK